MAMRALDEERAAVLERLCELIVPGSARVGPVIYIDALIARMPAGARDHALAAIAALDEPSRGGAEALARHAQTPEFGFVRALAIEAYYSDFVAAGRDVAGAWEEIDFHPPTAARLHKDWSYLGITG